MYLVRPMAADDLDAILRLDAAVPEAAHWGRAVYQGYLESSGQNPARRLFVAQHEETLIGYIAGSIVADVCELESIAVAASARRFGAGRALLAALTGWARSQPVIHMQLEVRAGNSTAISFYRDAGFRSDGLRPGYYQNPDEDALLMSLLLEALPEA